MQHDPCSDPSGTLTWGYRYAAAPSNPPISTAGVAIAPLPNGRVVALQNTQWYAGEGDTGYTPETAVLWLSADDGMVLATKQIEETFGTWASDLAAAPNGNTYVATGDTTRAFTSAPAAAWSTTGNDYLLMRRVILDPTGPALYTYEDADSTDFQPILHRLDPASGALVWELKSAALPDEPAAVRLFGGEVRVVAGDGSIFRVDATSGSALGSIAQPGAAARPSAHAAVVDANGVTYVVMSEVPVVGGQPTNAYVYAEDAAGALLWSTLLSSSFADFHENLTIALAGSTVLVGMDEHILRVDPASGAVTPWVDVPTGGASGDVHVRSIAFDGTCGVYVTGDQGTDCDQRWMTGCSMLGLRIRL
ncbi:MAG TPA: PQQ-binding-like beta-propeller repeat protein [Minicystis sp.]|nr:PQQ-binding-like beta-propeller repeat protein [Minicystis sp.]